MDSERTRELEALTRRLGLQPRAEALPGLQLALIHRSANVERTLGEDNERLEFLGDAVIGLLATEHLYAIHPDESEGRLSQRKATLVSRTVLGAVAEELGLGKLIVLGAGEAREGGRTRASVLGSALEAACGALYLAHAWSELRPGILERVIIPAERLSANETLFDYKSRLQEWTQVARHCLPEYRLVGAEGPDHDKKFVVEVWIGQDLWATGRGARKKAAENDAARSALERVPE